MALASCAAIVGVLGESAEPPEPTAPASEHAEAEGPLLVAENHRRSEIPHLGEAAEEVALYIHRSYRVPIQDARQLTEWALEIGEAENMDPLLILAVAVTLVTGSLGLLDAYLAARPQSGPERPLAALPRYARLAHFCSWLEQSGCITSTTQLLTALRLDRESVRLNSAAVAVLNSGSRDWKRLLRDYGRDAVLAAYPKTPALRRVLRSDECWELSRLAIGGDELRALGYSGPELGRELDRLLDLVIERPEINDYNTLCQLAERKVQN